ncbi:MAG: ester cyclase [Cyanobacteria bacterium J06632_19]
MVEGNKVVNCGTFTAKHLGEFQGIPSTRKQIEISIIHIDCLENGKIVKHFGQGDAQGLMQQLGIMFLPSSMLVPFILKNVFLKIFKVSN